MTERPPRLLLIGEEHVRDKVARHYDLLEDEAGIETHYFVDDRSGITRRVQEARERPLRVTYAPVPSARPRAVLQYWAAFRRCLERVRPDVLEVYTAIHFGVLYPMVQYARARGVRVSVVCRGELYPPVFYGETSAAGRWFFARILRAAGLVLYKELYMPEMLDRLAPGVPRFLWANAVPVRAEPRCERDGDVVLFLNFFKRWRNLDVVVRAAARVRERVPGVRFELVGGADELAGRGAFYDDLAAYEGEIRALVAELGLQECVRIHPFTARVEPWYALAKVYLLPADLVFCNYALLEAMERGVPAVVTDEKDPDARRIVDDGVDGRVVRIDPGEVADAVVELLADEERRLRMARAAHAKVRDRFNLQAWVRELGDRYRGLARGRRSARARAADAGAAAAEAR